MRNSNLAIAGPNKFQFSNPSDRRHTRSSSLEDGIVMAVRGQRANAVF